MVTIGLILLALVIVCGIIRIIITPSDSFIDCILDIFFLDFLWDLLIAIISAIIEE